MLALLMHRYGLRQSDLSDVASQSAISEMLDRKRELDLRRVRALAARFGVAMEVFAEQLAG